MGTRIDDLKIVVRPLAQYYIKGGLSMVDLINVGFYLMQGKTRGEISDLIDEIEELEEIELPKKKARSVVARAKAQSIKPKQKQG